MIELKPVALTAERFAPFGDVISASNETAASMNAARFDRFDDLASVNTDRKGHGTIGIVRCRIATQLPYRFDMVERHPLGSQAFVPLTPCRFMVVVAAPEEGVEAGDLCAFVSNGRQGINYHRGTWHMPLIAFTAGQEFLVIDRGGSGPNCDEHFLDEAVTLLESEA